MAVTRILASTWENQIAQSIGSRDIQVDTTVGPVRDVISYPVSIVCDRLNASIVQLSDIQSLTNVQQFTNADIDAIAYNSQIIRGPGAFATTTVSLLSTSPPTQDVTIPINFPFSTNPDSATGAVVFFASTQQVTYTASTANNYYDATTRMYKLDVPVQAVASGSPGNVGPNRIVQAQRSIGGFQRLTNFSGASGGLAQETNQQVADTLLIFNLGINDISTPYGIGLETTRQFTQITDYYVAYGSDPLLTRASSDAGATDLYFIGAAAVPITNSFTYTGQPLVMLSQPVISVSTVTSGPITFVQGIDYNFVPDTGPYGGSVNGQDEVQFLPTSLILPPIGATIQVTYNYNSLVATVQNFFDTPNFLVIGRSLLFKQGLQVLTSCAGTLTVLPNFDYSIVSSNTFTAIYNYINSLGLGQPLEEFDLISYISSQVGSAGGIDNFVLTVLNYRGQSGVLSSVTATGAQYLRINNSDILITSG